MTKYFGLDERVIIPQNFHSLSMSSISKVPAEIWCLIFEYLSLPDLAIIQSTCKAIWLPISTQVAIKLIATFLVDGESTLGCEVESADLLGKRYNENKRSPQQRSQKKPRWIPCDLLAHRSCRTTFRARENVSQMFVKLDTSVHHSCPLSMTFIHAKMVRIPSKW